MSTTTPEWSRFLQGLMAPVMDERDDSDLEVVGELPAGLRGMFVRNGPNPQFAPTDAYHPFDGDGMIHALYFEDGRVRYRNRWIASAGLLAERKRGRPCFGSVSRFRLPDPDVIDEAGMMKNNANTHVVRHAGRYLALMEAAKPTELTRELTTVGEFNFAGKLKGPMTAHPRLDPETGEMVFFGYSPVPPYLRCHVADASGALVHSTEIALSAPVMMHDFAMTERYVVFLDAPAVFDLDAMMRGEPAMRWEPGRGTRLGVLPRRAAGDQIRWFEVGTRYVVHFWNAWDDGDRIEVYAPAFERMPGALQFENPQQTEEPVPWHWSVDLAAGTVRDEQIDDRPGEFPRIDDARVGRRHRYMYNSLARDWAFGFDFNGVVKYDIETGRASQYIHPDTAVVGEHIFVPDPAGRAEDDGWVLTLSTDRVTERSELVVLDARRLDGGPLARVRIPQRVPLGFHANWFAA